MSVSMRSTKVQMYSEIERLRVLCDWQAQQLRTQPQARRNQAPDVSERRAKLEVLKAFAAKFNCSARLRDDTMELYSRKRACWVAVPEGARP